MGQDPNDTEDLLRRAAAGDQAVLAGGVEAFHSRAMEATGRDANKTTSALVPGIYDALASEDAGSFDHLTIGSWLSHAPRHRRPCAHPLP
jgi:hypothetical protein